MCFNAAKSWQLGWYDDKSSEVKPEDGAFTGDLSAFVDYKNVPTGGNVLIKVGTKYLIFNKAKGINAETQEFANAITITDMPRDGDFSDAVGSLGSNGATYRFGHSGSTAIIELCSTQNTGGVETAKISIYMEGTGSSCGFVGVGVVEKDGSGPGTSRTTDLFECILIEIAEEFEGQNTEYEHACVAEGDNGEYYKRYHIDDNNSKILPKLKEQDLDLLHHSNQYKVTMTNVVLESDSVVGTTPGTEIVVEDMGSDFENNSRRLKSVGIRTIVIVRVTTSDGQVSKTASQIADAFFGVGGDSNNLKSRYADCSMDKLTFNPGTGHDFVDGVAEISVSAAAVGANILDFQAKITDALLAKYGSSLRNTYNHVVYSVPKGTTMGAGGSDRWIAFAYMNSYLSVYNDDNIVYISNQVHETGHNLGLMHSNHGEQKYGDQSGTMGYGYGQ